MAEPDPKTVRTSKSQRVAYQTNVKKELKKLQSNLDPSAKAERAKIQTSINKLESYRSTLQQLDEIIFASIDDDAELTTEVTKSAEFDDEIVDHIALAKASLTTDQSNSTAVSKDGAGTSATASVNSAAKLSKQLPKIQITPFSGSPLKWQEFWDSFDSMIHSDTDMREIQKFQYLKGYLRGDALRMVDAYRMTEANYEAVIEQLQKRFGNKEVAIQAHLDALLSLKPAAAELRDLQRAADECETHIRSLINLDMPEDTFGRIYATVMMSKLPVEIRVELNRANDEPHWTLPKLRKLLQNEIHALQMSKHVLGEKSDSSNSKGEQAAKPKGSGNGKGSKSSGSGGIATTTSALVATDKGKSKPGTKAKHPCRFCKQVHYPDQCDVYPDIAKRKAALGSACHKCLNPNHKTGECTKRTKPCFHCKENAHHSSLCPQKFGKCTNAEGLNVHAAEFIPADGTLLSPSKSKNASRRGLAIMQTALVTVKGVSGSERVRVILDPASTRSYCRIDLLRRIGGKDLGTEQLAIASLESEKRKKGSYACAEIGVILQDNSEFPLTVNGVKSISCPIEKQSIDPSQFPLLRKIELADPVVDKPEMVQIDVLIGLDAYYQLVGGERIDLGHGLVLLGTKMGYIATGCLPASSEMGESNDTVMFTTTTSSDSELHELVANFWKLESIGITDPVKETDDELAQQMFDNTVLYDKGENRYMVKWPYKPDHPELPDNYQLALGRLCSLVKRLQRDPPVLQKYHATIQEQIAKQIVEEAPKTPDSSMVHYIPHHCVIKPDRTTTKLRIVYDASCKTKKANPSLNEIMFRGPVYLSDLCGLILRFRRHRIGIISDIEKAFLQVGLQLSERDVTRFLWLKDPSKPVTAENLIVYRFGRVSFGIIASPFLLAATIRYHLVRLSSQIANEILQNIYVDNVVAGRSSVEQSIEYYTGSKQMFTSAGMNLREWYSNSDEFIQSLPEADRGKATRTTVLGLKWDTKDDALRCFVGQNIGMVSEQQVTKRKVIQTVASLFDPCGYFCAVTIRGRILMQSLWRSGCDWDDPVPVDVESTWREFLTDFLELPKVNLPRYLPVLTEKDLEIHCFCDASTKAYGATIYVRSVNPDAVRCDLVFAKSRVSPIREQQLTIPKLELTALVLGCKLSSFVARELDLFQAKTYLWTDNQCSLHWVHSNKQSPVYVGNRVRAIRDFSAFEVRYIESENNPADLLTRGTSTEELVSCQLWWNGPSFLTEPAENWPKIPDYKPQEEVELQICVEAFTTTVVPLDELVQVSRFSCLSRLLRVMGWVRRFTKNCESKAKFQADSVKSGPLLGSDLLQAKQTLVRAAQAPLKTQIRKPNSNSIRQLGLFEDKNGLIRCSGRLDCSDLPYSAKHPMVLPKNSPLNDLIISDVHSRLGHAGLSHVLAELRSEIWIINARQQVKQVLRQCRVCRREKGGPFATPQPPPLPAVRSKEAESFSRVGLDYLGPLLVRQPQGEPAKIWICLFTCAVTRAIHLEVVADMTAQQFLLALRRFTAIYGKPALIICDNAKTFITSRSVTDKLFHEASQQSEVQNHLASIGVEWKFIVEMAPWMGGFYERMVALVKQKLKCTIQKKLLTFTEVQTVCAEVSAILNSRPLTVCEEEVGQKILTPNDLITHTRSGFPVVELEQSDENYLPNPTTQTQLAAQWRRIQSVVDQFWHSWYRDYLTSLRGKQWQPKNRGASREIPSVGSVVLLHEQHLPRNRWKMGKITGLPQSFDGSIRSATLTLASGKTVNRPLKLLYPLEVPTESTKDAAEEPVAVARVNDAVIEPDKPQRRPTRTAAIRAKEKLQQAAETSSDEESQ